MSQTGDTVAIQGLRELQRGLQSALGKQQRVLSQIHRRIAQEYAAGPARTRASSLGGGHVRLARAGVIGARGTARAAIVTLTAGAVPDAFGQEFGSKQGPRKRQFDPWRGNPSESTWIDEAGPGYALFPAIRANRQRIMDEYMDRLVDGLKEAFPE